MTASFIIIQPDWNEALWEPKGKCWVMLKKNDEKSAHGFLLQVGENRTNSRVIGSKGFEVLSMSRRKIVVKHVDSECSSVFVPPVQVFDHIHLKSVQDVDISPSGGLGVSCSTDGTMCVWETSNGVIRRRLEDHIGDVNCCKFYPSGLVVLSGGSDTQLKIWSVEDGSCARTLKGVHKSGILSIDMVERGKNVVSSSRDGSVRLWNCGSSECIADFTGHLETFHSVNCCSVQSCSDDLVEKMNAAGSEVERLPEESGTENKLLAWGSEDGNLSVVYMATRAVLSSYHHDNRAACNAVMWLDSSHVIGGYQDGRIVIYDAVNNKLASEMTNNTSAVLSISKSHKQNWFWTSFQDGRVALFECGPTSTSPPQMKCELSGPDCDAVYKVVECPHTKQVFTCCRDVKIRKYLVDFDSL